MSNVPPGPTTDVVNVWSSLALKRKTVLTRIRGCVRRPLRFAKGREFDQSEEEEVY